MTGSSSTIQRSTRSRYSAAKPFSHGADSIGCSYAQTASSRTSSPTRSDQYEASPLNGQCVVVSVRSSRSASMSASGTYATGRIPVSCSRCMPVVSSTHVSPTYARSRRASAWKRILWGGASNV